MFKLLKIIRDSSDKIIELQKEIAAIRKDSIKVLEDISIYSAIGMPFAGKYDRKIQLLTEARDRGYFHHDNHFLSANNLTDNTARFKHMYSNIASNYRYSHSDDSLHISAIGVNGNYSAGCVCIYKNGVWGEILSNKL